MKIVTGYKGTPHITATQDRMTNRGIIGTGKYFLKGAADMTATIVSNNEIRIYGGAISINGCIAVIEQGGYESVAIESGTQGKYRMDTICVRYFKHATTGVESVFVETWKGEEVDSLDDLMPRVLPSGDVDDSNAAYMPLYYVTLTGVNITGLDKAVNSSNPDPLPLATLTSLKLNRTGDAKDNTLTFNSYDAPSPSEPVDIDQMGTGETLRSLFEKVSRGIRNVRYILSKLGSVALPTTAQTITGAIAEHESDIATINGNLTATSGSITSHITAGSGITINSAQAIYNEYFCTIRIACSKTDGTVFATGRTNTNPLFTLDDDFKPEIAMTFPVVTNNTVGGAMSNYADGYIAASGKVIVDVPTTNTTAKQIQVCVTYVR